MDVLGAAAIEAEEVVMTYGDIVYGDFMFWLGVFIGACSATALFLLWMCIDDWRSRPRYTTVRRRVVKWIRHH